MSANAMEQKTAVFSMEQKTAVFHPGDLSAEQASAGRQMDDETRELPLIAGRFAGRQWIAEDLRREEETRPARKERPRLRRRRIAALTLCGVLALLVLAGALMVRSRLTAMNDEAVALNAEILALREERDSLRMEYAESADLSFTTRNGAVTLGMELRGGQAAYVAAPAADKATVLGVRRGHGAAYVWNSVLDTLGERFH